MAAISIPIISDFNPKGIDRAVREFQKLETTGQKAQFAIKKAAVPAAMALGVLADFAGDAVKAFMEDDKAAQLLATSLKNTTGATDAQVKAVEAFITKTSIAAAVSDDELRPALDKLVRGTGDVTKAQDLLNLALDISAGTGKDLGAVSDALSKAFNGQLGPLKKLDPALASLIENGATTDEVFAALASTFKGAASTSANTASGKMKSFSIQMGEFKESVGAAVMPIIDKLLPAFQAIGTWISQNVGLVVTLGVVIGGIAAAVVLTNAALSIYAAVGAATAAINAVMATSFTALWVATGAIVIIAIIAALVALQVKFDIFGKAIDGIKVGFNAVWGAIKYVFNWAKDNWPLLLAIITGPFGLAFGAILFFKDSVIGVFQGLKDLAGSIFDGISGTFKGVINAVISNLEKGLNFAIKGLNIILDGIDAAAGPWINFGSIPEVKLPRLAEGGIVTGPTLAMIGEGNGPEAVIPLSKLGSMGFGGGGGITVNVNGGDPNSIVRALQNYVRQSGPVPLNIRSM
tara:strand:+ start:691 stop:2247 length:1557 start_codon:yes stop_codon:yes gene_type:complete